MVYEAAHILFAAAPADTAARAWQGVVHAWLRVLAAPARIAGVTL